MARGRGHQEHLLGTVKALGDRETVNEAGEKVMKPAWQINALCNDQHEKRTTFVEPRDGSVPYGFAKFAWAHDCCSRCQSIFYKNLLKEKGNAFPYYLGERYDMSAPLPFGISKWTWKSVYPVYERGILADCDDPTKIVAFICIETGWGKSWSIHGWKPANTRAWIDDDPNKHLPTMDGANAQMRMYDFTYDGDVRTVDRSKPSARTRTSIS
jgi:hypothetical protein